jgi:sporulation protein YlmC with PRC-barrel domain
MVEITRLFWKKAFTSDGILLGEVESAELDMNTWQIINLFIGLTDEISQKLGFKHPFLGKIHVCLPVANVKTIEETAILNKTLDELKELKQCRE